MTKGRQLRSDQRLAPPQLAELGGELVVCDDDSRCPCSPGLAAWRWQSPSISSSTPVGPPRMAGGSRCRPIPPSPSACSRLSARASPIGCAFMLTVVIVDDILALVVIALVYTEESLFPRCSWPLGCSASSSSRRRSGCGQGSSTSRSGGDLGRAPRVGRRADRRRTRDGPSRLRLPGRAIRPRACDGRFREFPEQPTPSSPAPSGSASGPRSHRTSGCSCSPPVDKPDRAPVRARERGHRHRRRLPRASPHLADHARDHRRLRRRQARGHCRERVAARLV